MKTTINQVISFIAECKDSGCVYFIKDNGSDSVKIGMSSKSTPNDRFESFLTYSPYGGVLIGYIKTKFPYKLEEEIHEKYKNRRINREWFNLSIKESLLEIKLHNDCVSMIGENLEDSMIEFEGLLNQIKKITNLDHLVMILELSAHKSGVKTVSQMSRLEAKSPNGIRSSKAYRKIEIGGQLMCIKGLRDVSLPF